MTARVTARTPALGVAPVGGAPAGGPLTGGPPAAGAAVRVLVVDDSAVVRGVVARLLDAEPDLAVVGTAANGRQALDALARQAAAGQPADVVVLDVEMPELDGLAALPRILERHPACRVVMLSAHGGEGAAVTVRALALGAADFVCKPRAGAPGAGGAPAYAAELTRKVRAIGRSAQRQAARQPARAAPAAHPAPNGPPNGAPNGPPNVPPSAPPFARRAAQVLVVASSTGGPVALEALLGALPAPLGVPVLVTQHMPPAFTRQLAARLAAVTGHACAEAVDGEPVRPGRVYVAPGDHHLVVERRPGGPRLRLTREPPVQHCRPAADPMFASAAAAYGPGVLAVVLTGMGHDGRDGSAAVVRRGGRVLAQDEASSVVWGMPGAVAQAGLAGAVLPIPAIAAHVAACCAARGLGTPATTAAPARAAGLAS